MKIATRKRSFKELVGEFPFLTAAGLAEDPWHTFYDQPGCDWDFWFYRAWLLNTQERVERCAGWLEQNIAPTKTAQRGWALHSYALKHRYEERDIDGYMTEGRVYRGSHHGRVSCLSDREPTERLVRNVPHIVEKRQNSTPGRQPQALHRAAADA